MNGKQGTVCPVERAGGLESRLRQWLQNPRKIVEPFVREGMTVLDLGCGPGFFTLPMAELVGSSGRVIAADLQEGMLDRIRSRVSGTALEKRIVLHCCQDRRIGVTSQVEFILLFYMVHELPDQAAFFSEMAGILHPAGQVLMVEPPVHVSKAAFDTSLEKAEKAGFVHTEGPRIFLSKTALLQKAQR
jgi:ubiquinone/menaquinone biosynthesis C-methylase UbiE